jgi:peptidyl-prolyl cis-trans isomerase D
MMQVIRDKAQGIVAWVIVAIVAFVLCFSFVSGYFSRSSDPVVVKVNGKSITSSEIDDIYNRWLRFNANQNSNFDLSQVNPDLIKQQIAAGLANQMALIDSLHRDGITISDAMIIEAIRSKPEFQQDGKFSIELYKQFLAQLGMSEADFEEAMNDELLMNQVQLAIMLSSFATEAEAARAIELRNQKRDFGYAVIPASKYATVAKVTDEQIQDYYNGHKAQFVVPEKVQAEYIELSMDDIFKQVPISEQTLKEYYQANIQAFNSPQTLHVRHIMITATKGSAADKDDSARKEIEAVYAKLKAGAKFTDLAKEYSEDRQTAVNGGDLGWVSKNDNYPEEIFTLKNNGDYTQPVQSTYGWQIFQLVDRKGGQTKDFASVKNIVQKRYTHEAAEKLFSEKGNELANLTFENPTSLSVASEKLNLLIKTTGYFTTNGGSGIADSPSVIKAAFSEDVYKQKHNSELIRISDDSYVVLRIKDVKPASEQSLEDVRSNIVKVLQDKAASDMAKQEGDAILAAIKEGNNPNRITSSKNLQWVVKTDVERDNRIIDRNILRGAFAIPKAENATQINTNGFSLPNGDYVVMALTKVQNGVVEHNEDSNLLETTAQQLATLEGKLEYAALQKAMVEQAKIKYMSE